MSDNIKKEIIDDNNESQTEFFLNQYEENRNDFYKKHDKSTGEVKELSDAVDEYAKKLDEIQPTASDNDENRKTGKIVNNVLLWIFSFLFFFSIILYKVFEGMGLTRIAGQDPAPSNNPLFNIMGYSLSSFSLFMVLIPLLLGTISLVSIIVILVKEFKKKRKK